MPRRPNTRPTAIYWLVDMRPETLATWPNGLPFYCGKTVDNVTERLAEHKQDVKRYPHRKSAQRVRECGEHIRIILLETVLVNDDWRAREKHWIALLRGTFPGAANVADGGQGTPGLIPSSDTRAKMRAARLGKKHSQERCAKMRASNLGKTHTPETRAKISASQLGRKQSIETRAKRAQSHRGKKHSDSRRENMRKAWVRRRSRAESAHV